MINRDHFTQYQWMVWVIFGLSMLMGCDVRPFSDFVDKTSDINNQPQPTANAIRTTVDTAGFTGIYPGDPDEGQNHAFAITEAPENGEASIGHGGRVIYRPNEGHTGSDRFEITVFDNGEPSESGTVAIEVDIIRSVEAQDLENRTFDLVSGAAFHPQLAGIATQVSFGDFEEEAGSFTLATRDAEAEGTVTLISPDCLFTVIMSMFRAEAGPQKDAEIRIEPCEIDPDNNDCPRFSTFPESADLQGQRYGFPDGSAFGNFEAGGDLTFTQSDTAERLPFTLATTTAQAAGTLDVLACDLIFQTSHSPQGEGPAETDRHVFEPCRFDTIDGRLRLTNDQNGMTSELTRSRR